MYFENMFFYYIKIIYFKISYLWTLEYVGVIFMLGFETHFCDYARTKIFAWRTKVKKKSDNIFKVW